MKHALKSDELGEFALPVMDAVQKCVHCGFCLPTCPTYQVLGQEMDSPRGRILLMKEDLEGHLESGQALSHVDQCLGCLACETACPSAVPYGHLLNSYRALKHADRPRTLSMKIQESLVHQTVPYPARFRLAAKMGKLVARLGFLVPRFLRPMLELVPERLPPEQVLPEYATAHGRSTAPIVGLLTGCAQQVLAPQINASTVSVLNKLGVDVTIPRQQSCCGGLDWHSGRVASTRAMAKRNFGLFGDNVQAIVTNAAGCGSAIHEYDQAFAGTPELDDARRFASRVKDIAVFLAEQELPAMQFERPTRIGYHDACHLAHAQGIRRQPRQLLERIMNVELVPIRQSDTCCGSAGTYNLTQPEIAAELGRQKAAAIIDSGCDIVVAGNIGCLVQIRKYLEQSGSPIQVMHTIEILDQALPRVE